MIGLFLLYFIGKSYYDLADKYHKSKWGFAILGIVCYYAGTFIGGIVWAIIYEIGLSQSIDDVNTLLMSLMALPFGILTCWLLYRALKSQWSKSSSSFSAPEEILDANLINRQLEE